jgi:hypothetical protein
LLTLTSVELAALSRCVTERVEYSAGGGKQTVLTGSSRQFAEAGAQDEATL